MCFYSPLTTDWCISFPFLCIRWPQWRILYLSHFEWCWKEDANADLLYDTSFIPLFIKMESFWITQILIIESQSWSYSLKCKYFKQQMNPSNSVSFDFTWSDVGLSSSVFAFSILSLPFVEFPHDKK